MGSWEPQVIQPANRFLDESEKGSAITVAGDVQQELTVKDVVRQVEKIQELMRSVMRDGEHYGIIPGTEKPTLYKAGAEKLCFLFRLAPEFVVEQKDLSNLHREYKVVCTLRNMQTGNVVGTGVGLCLTMERKYRYRKVNGKQIDNPDIADQYNTVLKMAKKRALIDATITACAASDIFTQDLEDMEMPDNKELQAKYTAQIAEIMKSKKVDGTDLFTQAERDEVRTMVQELHKNHDMNSFRELVGKYQAIRDQRLKKTAPVQEQLF